MKRRKRKKQHILVPIQPGKDSFAKTELIYYAKSPDYCYPDEKTGSVGTRGRWVFAKRVSDWWVFVECVSDRWVFVECVSDCWVFLKWVSDCWVFLKCVSDCWVFLKCASDCWVFLKCVSDRG